MDPLELILEKLRQRVKTILSQLEIEQPIRYPKTVDTKNQLLQELRDIFDEILEILKRELKQKRKMFEEVETLKTEVTQKLVTQKRLATVVFECETRLEVLEAQIEDLEEEKRRQQE